MTWSLRSHLVSFQRSLRRNFSVFDEVAMANPLGSVMSEVDHAAESVAADQSPLPKENDSSGEMKIDSAADEVRAGATPLASPAPATPLVRPPFLRQAAGRRPQVAALHGPLASRVFLTQTLLTFSNSRERVLRPRPIRSRASAGIVSSCLLKTDGACPASPCHLSCSSASEENIRVRG